ncbi:MULTISPECIES: beta-galactosidase [Streptomyces]|uniref:Beta-galactosidase n=1 Tax=Streptomyces sviceus (strain ATCC 29083 / DSM 924 / JCM 4929 / NBRC 13980 / NCIMB 11184 / NRRL 5439 / UC 5370) TaxID=463191 RepID=B5HTD8_STRX2|nr:MULTISPECIES: beta-galactosidase [Streptomyces]EDY56093.1 beta-galactosidase [Streptomyces sviceus ATCC 29083]MYT09062.1 beta-galactosidase [Streptomyces sp. SID5470]
MRPSSSKIPYGGDYNPEQWPAEVWDADHRLFTRAGIDTLTVGVFSWSLTQPAEDTYDFTVLDRILDRAAAEGRQVCLATGTAALPPWLAKKYPEVNRTDFEGRRHRYGQRHNFCPSSPAYRGLAAKMAARLAERYADHPALLAWHVNNEYGGACYCDLCADAFRDWLRDRYGTLDALNDAWWTTFWSHRYTSYEEIEPPNALTEHWRGPDHTAFQGITLDYLRFTTDALLGCFLAEKEVIRARDPVTPVTTNFMGMFRPLDYHRWAPHLDFASWDSYPPLDAPPTWAALAHDLMRGLKDGAPFWLMEQTPSTTACRDVNPLRRPGELRLATFQAIAHGADAALYFQLRASRGACEKYHGAVIGHAGRDDTRVFREVAVLGAELEQLGDVSLGARTPARTALLFDWDSWWALEISDGPSRLVKYQEVVHAYYRAAREAGADVDVVPHTADLTPYDVVLTPALHMVKGDLATRLEAVAERGGTVLATFLSGRVDAHDRAFLTDVPGPLAPLMGIRIDEWDSRRPEFAQSIPELASEGRLVFEIVRLRGAEAVATYGSDFYAGTPAVTRNAYGQGEGWYVATALDQPGVDEVVRRVLDRHDLVGPYAGHAGVETANRTTPDGTRLLFLLNHTDRTAELKAHIAATDLLTGKRTEAGAPFALDPRGVAVLRLQ